MAVSVVAGQLVALRGALTNAAGIASTLVDTQEQWTLNSYELSGHARVEQIPVDQPLELARNGHLIELTIRSATWSLFVRLGGHEGPIFEPDGPVHAAVDAARVDALERAIARADLGTTLSLLEGSRADLSIKIANRPQESGSHWIHSAEQLHALSAAGWLPLATELAQGPARLLVDDLGDAVVRTEGLVILGLDDRSPADLVSGSVAESPTPAEQNFLARRSTPVAYPSPLRFVASRITSGTPSAQADLVVHALDTVASLLVWALVANSATPEQRGVEVRVSGVREVIARIATGTTQATEELAALYRWVALSPEADRLDFVQQALALAVVNDADTATAAGPALRTAKSLYELSRRGSVAEAMAARRAARDAAISAGRGAAAAGRDAAGKAVERTVLQVIAAAGVVIAQLKSALSTSQAVALLLMLGGLCAGLLVLTLRVTLESAKTGLDEELIDLDQYRDSLSVDDIDAIRATGTIKSARDALRRARASAWWAYGGSIVLAVAAALILSLAPATTGGDTPPSEPTPTPSNTSPQPSLKMPAAPSSSPRVGSRG